LATADTEDRRAVVPWESGGELSQGARRRRDDKPIENYLVDGRRENSLTKVNEIKFLKYLIGGR